MLLSRSIHLRRACGTALVLLAVACGGPAERPASPIASDIPPSPGQSIARTALPTSTVAPTAAPTPVVGVGEPWIAFTPDGPYQVRLVRPDGTDMHSPTGDVPPGTQTNPDWSRDGQTLVFGLTSGTRDDLWIVGADGRGARVLVDCEAPCAWFDDPAWAPDGRTVVWSRFADGFDVWAMAPDGTSPRAVTTTPYDELAPSVSPDGRDVVFQSTAAGSRAALFVAPLAGGTARPLGDAGLEPLATIPADVKAKWKTVELSVAGKDIGLRKLQIPVGGETGIDKSGLTVRVVAYVPAFQSDAGAVTSASNSPDNPAVLIQLVDKGQVLNEGWVFQKLPDFNTYSNDRLQVQLLAASATGGS